MSLFDSDFVNSKHMLHIDNKYITFHFLNGAFGFKSGNGGTEPQQEDYNQHCPF